MGKIIIEENLEEIMAEMKAWREQVEQFEYEASQEEAREVYGTLEGR